MSKKEVAEKQNTEVGSAIDYGQYGRAGYENADSEDFAVPFIYIVQKNSKVIDTNPEARPGMFYNNVTGQLYKELLTIPCEFVKEYVEWLPVDAGGGYKGRHDWDSNILEQCSQVENPTNGKKSWMLEPDLKHEIVDTRKHYVICIAPETGEIFPAIIAMTSTQSKKSRRWLSTIRNQIIELQDGRKIPAPSFAFTYEMSTVQETKDTNTWYGWAIKTHELIEDESLFQQAHDFYQSVRSTEINEATPDQ